MKEVFFKRSNYAALLRAPAEILDGFKRSRFAEELTKGKVVGLKVHFGEKGNRSYLNPALLFPLVKFLKEKGTRPFLLETNTLYRGQRMNAVDHINLAKAHGFGKLNIPLIIGDGIKGNDYFEVAVNKKHFSACFLAQALKDVDFLLSLAHFTGHLQLGFGAAIKNLGMGCASRKGKMLQHCQVSPKINQEQCSACGICFEHCPAQAIVKEEKFSIAEDKCIGCAQCISVCPQSAVKIIWFEECRILGEKMVEYAWAVSRSCKCAYINFCIFVTKECDCMNKEKEGITEDLGVLYSWDPVSIDKASIDLLTANEKKDFLSAIHPKVNYLDYLQYAEGIGLGSLDYKLIEI